MGVKATHEHGVSFAAALPAQPCSRRRALALLVGGGLTLAGCRREPRFSQPEPGFQQHRSEDVVRAFEGAGLPVAEVRPRPIATATPNPNVRPQPKVSGPATMPYPIEPMVEVEARTFVIPTLGDKGGRIFVFDSAERLRAKQIYYARFPDLYPYVFAHEDVLLWLDPTLPADLAERYRAALLAL